MALALFANIAESDTKQSHVHDAAITQIT